MGITKPTILVSFFDMSVQIMTIQISSENNSNILSIFVTLFVRFYTK